MKLMGIADEAGAGIDTQIKATKELGWKFIEMRNVEVPGFGKANLHDIPDAAFEIVYRKLNESEVGVYCFGSTIMNWSKKLSDPWEITVNEVKRAIPRMKWLGAKYIRIMSFKPQDDEYQIPPKVFERVKEVTNMFLDEGLQPLHENCMNYGGMSPSHALELLDKVPGLKWVFDTANPVFNPDRSKPRPWKRQDAFEFWVAVRDFVEHIHIKDATWNPAKNDADYNWPGEGQGKVREILKDAFSRGYDKGISIEPHIAVVFHDTSVTSSDEAMFKSYIEYGKRLEKLIAEVKADLSKQK